MCEYKKTDLLKQNMKQFFSQRKTEREYKKRYKTDKLLRQLPAESTDYDDFAPQDNISNAEEYIKALHWGLKNKRARNIALAGPYGSGKSSIIQSYLRKYPSTRAIIISLAAFNGSEEQEKNDGKDIEHGVLKQLFYKVDSGKIPQSRYHKLRKIYYWKYLMLTAGIALMVLTFFLFFFPESFKGFIDRIVQCGNYYKINNIGSILIALIFGACGILAVSYMAKWCVSHFKIREINLADKATILNDKGADTSFDGSLDEIIYFFEETDYDVVFIEDIDRFNNAEIFTKLRELNIILNEYELIRRKITFVYSTRDDIFQGVERTKFFDFIIPVIPIINSTNSGDILRVKLKVSKQEDGTVRSSVYDISSGYITLVSSFIEDMRVLTSICNEFIIYKYTLQSLRLKDEEMFSIMIFKNLYPRDFAELESEKGIIKQAFEDKKSFIAVKQSELKKEVCDCEHILNIAEQDILKDAGELKAAFLNFLAGGNASFTCCSINRRDYYAADIMQDDFDMSTFDNAENMEVYCHDGNRRIIEKLSEEMQKQIRDYLDRYRCLQNSDEEKKEELRKKIEENENTIANLPAYSLKSLIKKFGSDAVLSENVLQNRFLVFMLRNGLINENYADYINYFHPNSITKDEMNFVRGIRMREAIGDYAYAIRNVAQVCERIADYEFRQKEVLNYDIIDYLVAERPNDKKCTEMFRGLADIANNKTSNEFIRLYIERKKNIAKFTQLLCKHYKFFWYRIAGNDMVTEEGKFQYLSLIIEHADLNDIVSMNNVIESDCIKNFIVEKRKALRELSKVSAGKMIALVERLELEFSEIEISGADKSVLEYIFEKNRYVLNINMVESLFSLLFPGRLGELKTANYSTILDVAYKPLLIHVSSHFERYVSEFVLGQETDTHENVTAVEDILERLYFRRTDLCLEVLSKENVFWVNMEDCCKSEENEKRTEKGIIWDQVIKNNMLKGNWDNFLIYYNAYGLTEVLVKWVDRIVDLLLQDERTAELTDQIIKEIILANVSLETFEKLISTYEINVGNCRIADFGNEKAAILVKRKYIPFSIDFFMELKEKLPECITDYVLNNKDAFFENIGNISLDIRCIADILKTGRVTDEEVSELLSQFVPKDMDEEMACVIRNLEVNIDKSYVESAWSLLREEDRYQLLLNQLDRYTLDEISQKLSELAPEYKAMAGREKRHREYLSVDEYGYNERLLEKLRQRKYLTSVEKEEYEENSGSNKIKKHRFAVWVKQK